MTTKRADQTFVIIGDYDNRDSTRTGYVKGADLQLQPIDTAYIGNKAGGWGSGALQFSKTAMRFAGKRPAVVQRLGRTGGGTATVQRRSLTDAHCNHGAGYGREFTKACR